MYTKNQQFLKEAHEFIEDLIEFCPKLLKNNKPLPYPVLREFASICLKHLDEGMECLVEAKISFDLHSALVNHLKEESEDTLFDLDQAICSAASEYYRDIFEEMFEERVSFLEDERMSESGFTLNIDRENGEKSWWKGLRGANQ